MAPPNLSKNAPKAVGVMMPAKRHCSVALEGSTLSANGHPVLLLTQVPHNNSVPSSAYFVGLDGEVPASWHVASVGRLGGIKLMSIFRFKVRWTTHWTGVRGDHVKHETQMTLLDRNELLGRPHVVLLPIIEGSFRASLQPGVDDLVDICVESSSSKVCRSSFRSCLYMQVGDDLYALIKEAVKEIRRHLGTLKLLEEKTTSDIINKFGWCTWDGFYLKVHPEGKREGIKSLVEGGCPSGMFLIDDGWQSICHDENTNIDQEGMNRTAADVQMPCHLIKFEENYKFRDYESKGCLRTRECLCLAYVVRVLG